MKEKTAYLEALRYIDNAKKILSNHAGKEGRFYSDPKYVKMACNTAYTGILVALDAKYKNKKKPGERADVEKYRKLIGAENRAILNCFNGAYDHLHLSGGYDGNLTVDNSNTGLELALKVIEWTKPYSDK